MRIVKYTDDELVEMIRDGSSDGFICMYEYHKEYCMNFMKSKYYDQNEIKDIYQDAVIVLYEKVLDTSFELSCSIQTYLNSICRNQVLVRLQKAGRFVQKSDEGEDYIETLSDWFENLDDVNQERVQVIQSVLQMMKLNSSKCYDMLVRFWYEKQTMVKIAQDLGYTNAENAKHQKSRCQQKMKLEVFKRMRRE